MKVPSKQYLIFVAFFIICLGSNAQGMWTWMHGSNLGNSTGTYGTKGVSSPINEPPARYQAAFWTDLDGNFWLFGGVSNLAFPLNDMWKFDVTTNQWTWVSGESANNNVDGIYRVMGIPSINNYPSARGWGANCWTDNNGDLWLFGGFGVDNTSFLNPLNDLWKYHIATNEWTWVSGSNVGGTIANYGTMGVPSPLNDPGGRVECKSSWVDTQNNLWMFGGQTTAIGAGSEMNDMWKYDIGSNQWTFMKGDMIGASVGNYGIKNVEDPANVPSGRLSYTKWKGVDGNFYIFAGGIFSTDSYNDVWRFNPITNNWTWISGSNITNEGGIYGTQCNPDPNTYPSARIENQTVSTLGCTDVFWSFGGFNDLTATNCFNDLWLYNISNNKWTWVSGSNASTTLPSGNYGTKGIAATSNMIPSKGGVCIWSDKSNNLWVFGGFGSPVGTLVLAIDLWRFQPDTACFNAKLSANLSLVKPIDTALCVGESTSMSLPNATITFGPNVGITTNSDTSILTFNPAVTTTYYVTASDTGKCGGKDSISFTIFVAPTPDADFIVSPTYTTLDNPTFNLINQSSNATTYEWYYKGSMFSTQPNETRTYSDTGRYCFTLFAYNTLGCMDSITKCANIIKPETIFIPNAFSPNSDHTNNVIKVLGAGFELINFSIYNRWGELMFQTYEQELGWDGRYKGRDAEVGTYYYIVDYYANDIVKTIKGDISLIR